MKEKKQRWSANDPFYVSKRWRSLRNKYIDTNPLDELKLQYNIIEAGEIVDHIIPRSIMPQLELEEKNLQTLSYQSHQQKTARSQGIDNIYDFIKEMENGKLMYITTEDKRKVVIDLVKQIINNEPKDI